MFKNRPKSRPTAEVRHSFSVAIETARALHFPGLRPRIEAPGHTTINERSRCQVALGARNEDRRGNGRPRAS